MAATASSTGRKSLSLAAKLAIAAVIIVGVLALAAVGAFIGLGTYLNNSAKEARQARTAAYSQIAQPAALTLKEQTNKEDLESGDSTTYSYTYTGDKHDISAALASTLRSAKYTVYETNGVIWSAQRESRSIRYNFYDNNTMEATVY